jgi:predicted Zn-ribbon and HTH transcriptional regulator
MSSATAKDILRTADPLMTVYDTLDKLYEALGSKDNPLSLRGSRGWENRRQWKRGFSQCRKCKSKLMSYLYAGHSFNEIMRLLHERHPEIKNVRKYAQNVIRQTTGDGYFDDWIVSHKYWHVRKPILAPPEIQEILHLLWMILESEGNSRIETEKSIEKHLKANSKTGALLKYVMSGRRRR